MKKLIYGGLFLAVLGIGIVSCKKNIQNSNSSQNEQSANISQRTSESQMSNSDLINAIKGQTSEYLDIENLEELLIKNSRLNTEVLTQLILESRVPNYIVETIAVLSAPIDNSLIQLITAHRPSLSTTAIQSANVVNPNAGFVLINTSPRQIIFGNGINKVNSDPNCNCGSARIDVASNSLNVTLTLAADNYDDPMPAAPCNSNNTDWICGTAKKVTYTGGDGTTATFEVVCTQSTKKCIRKVSDARFN